MFALTSESVSMSDDSESNSSLIKQFQWVTKFRAGPSGYANNKTLAGPQWFLTEAEAISDAEKNAENHVKDYPNFQDYDGYYIDTKIISSKNSETIGSFNDDGTSEENVNDESAESDDSRGLVLDTDGDSAPVTLGKRKFKEDVSEDQDRKRKSDGISSSKSEDCSDVIKPVKSTGPISIKLGVQRSKENASILQKASSSVAKAFNPDTDSEEEEMPPEAKMRMRNIGRDTPTSAGPNSFGKTRQGFCDTKKVWERKMKDKIREVADDN